VFDLSQYFQSIQTGHHHIDNEYIWLEAIYQHERFNAISRLSNNPEIWFTFQQMVQTLTNYWMIVSQD